MIYILIEKPKTSIYENGCFQQSLFVYYVIKNCGYNVKLCSTNYEENAKFNDIQIYDTSKLYTECKLIIMVSAFICDENVLKKMKKHNIKIIGYNCGNLYYIYQEDLIFDKHNIIGKRIFGNKYYDQIWTIPNYDNQLNFIKAITDTQCISVPYVWDKDFVLGDTYKLNKNHDNYNIIIFEPNMNLTKTCLIPLLICNELHKSGYIINVFVVGKPNTQSYINLCEMFKFKIESYPRLMTYDVLKQLNEKTKNMNIILSHHKDNPLNFLHLEMLYLNYPLIHNSSEIKEYGYYYETIEQGKNQIINCINNYSNSVQINNIYKYSPHNIENIIIYKSLIDNIMK
jgi:hypothetical protein